MTAQNMHALARANVKREGVADFKRSVSRLKPADAALKVAHAVDHDYDDDVLGSARMRSLLASVPRLGRQKATRCLRFAGVDDFEEHLRHLTPRQRDAIVAQLELWAWTWSH